MSKINPYLKFDGTAEEAFNFYKSIFGGEFAALMRFGEMPGCEEMELSEADKAKVMHAALPIGGDSVLMASDIMSRHGDEFKLGDNFAVSVSVDSRDEADRIFKGLADGGREEMPLQDTFWGSYFGMLHDRFGVEWMVSFDERYAN